MPKRNPAIEKIERNHSIFVDSGAWIALFSSRDQHHEDADRVFRKIVASKRLLLTSNLILAEIHRLLLFGAGSKAALAALAKIEASSLVRIVYANAKNHQSAKEWLQKLSDQDISYTDAVSFSMMEDAACREALSYDHHFRVAGFEIRTAAGR